MQDITDSRQSYNITLSKQVDMAQLKLQQLHYKRVQSQTSLELKYLFAEINNSIESIKLEKQLKKICKQDYVENLKNTTIKEKQERYLKIVGGIFEHMKKNSEKEGPLYIMSSHIKRWKERIICINTEKNILTIKFVDKDKEKQVNLNSYDKEFIGMKKKKNCFLLKVKKEFQKQVKKKELLFAHDDEKQARNWYCIFGGEGIETTSGNLSKESMFLQQLDQDDQSRSQTLENKQIQDIQQQQQQNRLAQSALPSKQSSNHNLDQSPMNNNKMHKSALQKQTENPESPSQNHHQSPMNGHQQGKRAQAQSTPHMLQKQPQKVIKQRKVAKEYRVPFIFQEFDNDLQLEKAHSEKNYKCIDFKENQRILQHQQHLQKFKIVLSLKANVEQVFSSVSEPERLIQVNSNIQESNYVEFMRSENTAIVYQKNKSIGAFYKSREFTFIRFCKPINGSIVMYDKSIDYQMKGGYTVQAGDIKSAIWFFSPHPDNKDTTIMTLSIDMSNNGFNNEESDGKITLEYLQSFGNLQNYIDTQIKPYKNFQPKFDLEETEIEEYEDYEENGSLSQIQEDEAEQNPSDVFYSTVDDSMKQQSQLKSQQQQNQQKQQQNNIEDQETDLEKLQKLQQQGQTEDDQDQDLEKEMSRFALNEIILQAALYAQVDQNHEQMDKLMDLVESGKFEKICLEEKNYPMLPESYELKKQYKQIKSDDQGNYVFKRNWRRDQKTGRMYYVNQEVIQKQQRVAKYIIKTMGGNLLKGKSLLSISMPVDIFDNRSNLERTAYSFSFAPTYLEKAAQMDDPLDQLKQTTAFLLTSTLMYLELCKPFNPILGETYQGFIKGSPIYIEQISHHPPILAFQLYGRGYRFEGFLESIALMHLNSFEGHNYGDMKVKFYNTGNEITLMQPAGTLFNTISGDRYLNLEHRSFAIDKKNQMATELYYNPDKKGALSFGKQKTDADSFRGGIYKLTQACMNKLNTKYAGKKLYKLCSQGFKEKEDFANQICAVEGIWSKHMEIDGQQIFHIEDGPYGYKLEPTLYPLPSDCNFREDIIQLRKGDMQSAQEWKEKLEVKQRQDRKYRDKYAKNNKKK